MPFRSQRNVPTALFVCNVSLFIRFYTPTLCLGSRFERDTKYPKSVNMYGQNKIFQISHQKIFQGREKMFHATPERRLRQGSNEMLDRSNETSRMHLSTPKGPNCRALGEAAQVESAQVTMGLVTLESAQVLIHVESA
ncbi:hypothetical protein TNCV_4961921 [Trichonephila clavipes]|nr:hypothetical protein TNCV_4961921 [Trichonephila clavipes]